MKQIIYSLFIFLLIGKIVESRDNRAEWWVSINSFNEAECPETSIIGGISLLTNACYKQQILSCSSDGSQVTVTSFSTSDCSGTPGNSSTYPSNQCGAAGSYGFVKTYTCSSGMPSYPTQSFVISSYETCQSPSQPSQIYQYRWTPTYKCMTLQRCGWYCGGGSSSASASTGTSTGSSNSQSSNSHIQFPMDKYKGLSSADKFWKFLDEVSGFPDMDDNLVLTSTGMTGSGFGTGTGGSGSGGSDPAIYTAVFGLAQCNATNNAFVLYYDGQSPSSAGGLAMSTGHYSSGVPFSDKITSLPTASASSATTGSTGTPNPNPPNGCSIWFGKSTPGKNGQQCSASNTLTSMVCVPPYHS